MAQFRFTTSLPGLIEGRVIEVAPPFGPDIVDWIRLGILVPVRGVAEEVALAPAAIEQAIARRSRRGRRGSTRATVTADGAP